MDDRSSSVRERALYVLKTLKKEFPGATTELTHKNPLQLLISTILSAQTTDVQVNKATPSLFRRFKTPEEYAEADIEEIEKYIRTLGFYHSKAKYIKKSCKKIVEKFDSKVPETMEELTSLTGVARKTANIVLCHGFGKQEGIAVDTHVKRISRKLGLSREKTPEKIEKDLIKMIPRKDRGLFSDIIILHGRKTCIARRPKCDQCKLNVVCPQLRE